MFDVPEGIIEVYGASGTGKSTMCIQYAIDFLQLNSNKKTLYISIDQPFCVRRLYDILHCKDDLSTSDVENIASRFLVLNLRTMNDQTHFIRYFLGHLVENLSIGIVILDSICGNIRPEYRDIFLTRDLYYSAHIFRKCFLVSNCKFLCINQVTDDIECKELSYQKPCLGKSWSNSVNMRIYLERIRDSHIFIARIIFSGHLALASHSYTIERSGIVFL